MASLISCGGALLLPGVSNVSPRLLGFRLDGVGGLTKFGEVMEVVLIGSTGGRGKLEVEAARPGFLEVLTARFFRFRPFLGGGCFCNSK